MNTTHSYKDLIVWQKSIELVAEVYKCTEDFPKTEMYGLTSQMRRAAISIPANIAEGRRRRTLKDFQHFLTIAYGSGAEIETYVEIIPLLPFGHTVRFDKIKTLLDEIMRMLNAMLTKNSINLNKLVGQMPNKLNN